MQTPSRISRSSDTTAHLDRLMASDSLDANAKRLLKEAANRLDGLEGALGGLKVGDGEKRRREEVVAIGNTGREV